MNYTISLKPSFGTATISMARFPIEVPPGDAIDLVMNDWETSAKPFPVQVTSTVPEALG